GTHHGLGPDEAVVGVEGTRLVAGVAVGRRLDQLRAGDHLRQAEPHLATGAEVRLLHGSVAVRPYTGEVLHAGHQGRAHHVPEVDVVVGACDAADEASVRIGELEL